MRTTVCAIALMTLNVFSNDIRDLQFMPEQGGFRASITAQQFNVREVNQYDNVDILTSDTKQVTHDFNIEYSILGNLSVSVGRLQGESFRSVTSDPFNLSDDPISKSTLSGNNYAGLKYQHRDDQVILDFSVQRLFASHYGAYRFANSYNTDSINLQIGKKFSQGQIAVNYKTENLDESHHFKARNNSNLKLTAQLDFEALSPFVSLEKVNMGAVNNKNGNQIKSYTATSKEFGLKVLIDKRHMVKVSHGMIDDTSNRLRVSGLDIDADIKQGSITSIELATSF